MYYTNNPPAATPKVRLSSSSCLSPFLSHSVPCSLITLPYDNRGWPSRTCYSPLRRKPAAGNILLEPQQKSWRGLRVAPYAPKQLCFSGRPGVKYGSPEKTDTLLPHKQMNPGSSEKWMEILIYTQPINPWDVFHIVREVLEIWQKSSKRRKAENQQE